jgi:rare lipoprotein A
MRFLKLVLISLLVVSCATASKRQHEHELGRGVASWYGKGLQGHKTASGEKFDMYQLTAAHRTLPFGTVVKVRSLTTHREVSVRINDRGPFAKGRIIDLSYEAARQLGMLSKGEDEVELVP